MRTSTTKLLRVLALLLAFVLIASSCGDDGDSGADSSGDDSSGDDSSGDDSSGDDSDGNMADDSLDPVKIGLITQDEELIAFPEVRAAADAYVAYFNAELGGIDGHPVELAVCGAGDAPESHVSCAQEFVNDDSLHLVISGGFLANSAAIGGIFADAGKPVLVLGNDFIDYLVPGVFSFDPGLPGLAQVFFVYASQNRGLTTMTLFIADDPAFEPFIPALEAIAAANGITINEVIPLGFEPDLTGPVSAGNTDNEGWLFVLADPAQCTAAAAGVDTVGYDGDLFANDLCLGQSVIESGAVDGWAGPVVSRAPTVDGGAEVDEIVRILDTYGSADAQTAGLAGWALANVWIARDVLAQAGGADATDASVMDALNAYSSDTVPGYPPVECPGPSAWVGACNESPLMISVVDGQMTAPDGFVELDFADLDFLLE